MNSMANNSAIHWSTAAAGLITAVLAVVLLLMLPSEAENLAEGFRTPVIAFEFAQTEADLAFLKDSKSDRDAMRVGHWWDMGFAVAYGVFLALLLVQFGRAGQKFAWFFVPIALLAVPFDIWENIVLLQTLNDLQREGTGAQFLGVLHIVTWLKWGAIGLGAAGVSLAAWGKGEYLSAGIAFITYLVTVVSWLLDSEPFWVELMSLLVVVFFFWFIVKQWVFVFRDR